MFEANRNETMQCPELQRLHVCALCVRVRACVGISMSFYLLFFASSYAYPSTLRKTIAIMDAHARARSLTHTPSFLFSVVHPFSFFSSFLFLFFFADADPPLLLFPASPPFSARCIPCARCFLSPSLSRPQRGTTTGCTKRMRLCGRRERCPRTTGRKRLSRSLCS